MILLRLQLPEIHFVDVVSAPLRWAVNKQRNADAMGSSTAPSPRSQIPIPICNPIPIPSSQCLCL